MLRCADTGQGEVSTFASWISLPGQRAPPSVAMGVPDPLW